MIVMLRKPHITDEEAKKLKAIDTSAAHELLTDKERARLLFVRWLRERKNERRTKDDS